jgi:hypothetical protein
MIIGFVFLLGLSSVPIAFSIYSKYKYSLKDRRLSQLVAECCNKVPELAQYPVLPSNRTVCINKHTIEIDVTTCRRTDSDLLERLLHEYAHCLNTTSYHHDDSFRRHFHDLNLKCYNIISK